MDAAPVARHTGLFVPSESIFLSFLKRRNILEPEIFALSDGQFKAGELAMRKSKSKSRLLDSWTIAFIDLLVNIDNCKKSTSLKNIIFRSSPKRSNNIIISKL